MTPEERRELEARGREREERGRELEGLAFTFCKAAFLALLLRRYTLFACASASVVLYLAAAREGVRTWRCFVKPPWVVAVYALIAAAEARRLWTR